MTTFFRAPTLQKTSWWLLLSLVWFLFFSKNWQIWTSNSSNLYSIKMYHFLKITYLPSYYLIYFFCPWNIHSPQLNMKSLPLSPLKNKTVKKWKCQKCKKEKMQKNYHQCLFFIHKTKVENSSAYMLWYKHSLQCSIVQIWLTRYSLTVWLEAPNAPNLSHIYILFPCI